MNEAPIVYKFLKVLVWASALFQPVFYQIGDKQSTCVSQALFHPFLYLSDSWNSSYLETAVMQEDSELYINNAMRPLRWLIAC